MTESVVTFIVACKFSLVIFSERYFCLRKNSSCKFCKAFAKGAFAHNSVIGLNLFLIISCCH